MIIALVILVLLVIVLAFALHTQSNSNKKQAEEQQQLLTDYQRRVDEQEKLLEDYRSLEKNFNNVGEGYEQALLAFDKMEEDQQKVKSINEALQHAVSGLQDANARLKEDALKKSETMKQVMTELYQLAGDDMKMVALLGKLSDIDDLALDLPPIDRSENIMVTLVSDGAIKQSGIDKAQFIKFETKVDPAASVTMLTTNQQKAVRALTHLLDNALKFTTDGTVTLSVDLDMQNMKAVYTVEDTGGGIDAAEAEHIFEPYVKLNQYFDGQGIGLTVARNIARRLGGDLVLDTTKKDAGARFVLSLPI